jgi:hypothetical protein
VDLSSKKGKFFKGYLRILGMFYKKQVRHPDFSG